MTPTSLSALGSKVRLIAILIGCAIAFALPTAVGYFTYSNLREMLEFRAILGANRVSEYAYAQGDTWRFSDARVRELVDFVHPKNTDAARVRVLSASGAIVAQVGAPVSFPALRAQAPISVQDIYSGDVIIETSLLSWLFIVLTVMVLGVILGILAFWAAVSLPRRSLDAAINDHSRVRQLIDARTTELQIKTVELERALNKERDLNLLQRQFVSMASHEFRTPLTIIDTAAQGLARRFAQLTPDEAIKRIDKIRDAVKRIVRLIESTLMAARMEEGAISIKIDACKIGEVVRLACERYQELVKTHTINCKLIDLPDTVRADTGALEQVLSNLLSNAVKYSPNSHEIDVVSRGERGEVAITVRDHGLGIDEDDLPRMFERFFRAKTSIGIAGTGIGLNLSQMLMKMHGGTISVDSRKGEGSTFTLRLPVDGPEKTTQAVSHAA